MSTPYIGFGNDTLAKLPPAKEGDEIDCPNCGGRHALECGTTSGKKINLLMFYKCGEATYLGAVAGKLTIGQKADVSGSMDLEN